MGSRLLASPPSLLASEPPRRLPIVAPRPPSRLFLRCRHLTSRRSPPPVCSVGSSWADSDESLNDSVGGWFVRKLRIEKEENVAARSRLHLAGIVASAAILLAALAYYRSAKRGFKFCFTVPFHTIYKNLMPVGSEKDPDNDITSTIFEVDQVSEINMDEETKSKENDSAGARKQIIVPVAADTTQQEAVSVLKKLKIIENDVSTDGLCTRREYARWFVKANSMLERNPKHKILPKISAAGPFVTAFDDVNLDDPDFCCIQSLAEAGIVLSKLSALNSSSISDKGASGDSEKIYFYPESYISRFDLLNWKALLEYLFSSELDEKMLRTKGNFLDLSASSGASPQLLLDLMAGDNSITRRAFGNIRRLQPHKPVTTAQAAVVLTSGRTADAIQRELSRLEAENISRLQEAEEIRCELVQRGDIQRFWEEKLAKEQERHFEVEKDLEVIFLDLEDEKASLDGRLAEYAKEKAALDCQQHLLQCLKDEVEGMNDKLASERANFISEQQSLERFSADLCGKKDGIVEAKSILEAEIEATRILRSWVEEEALQMRNRADVLSQAVLRWQYTGVSGQSVTFSVDSNSSEIVLKPNGEQSVA
ncbi:uncharacterized protein LOC103976132 isoform X4 [Musa acuminata AAA Group]|uniref:SLH domain-containing protein n=1 Tax=Musa acuminata subsp. malaccensis TaxID=214687 RepID=A0A804I0T5_MUSAM|nr:PREDICTED: uncharacterized protein LOC103976132 isoform X2 [Musa acuminata subsp. malaccensis]